MSKVSSMMVPSLHNVEEKEGFHSYILYIGHSDSFFFNTFASGSKGLTRDLSASLKLLVLIWTKRQIADLTFSPNQI